uniref:hypothetical protein n=1 Tax=Leptospira santarosai TaxID=28183 RepID=UPI001C4000BD
NSEGIGAKSAVASHFNNEIRERFAKILLRRTHVIKVIFEIELVFVRIDLVEREFCVRKFESVLNVGTPTKSEPLPHLDYRG